MKCCNCGYNMGYGKRNKVSSLSLKLQTKLSQWLSKEVADDLLCDECLYLVSSDNYQERVLGHNKVCSGCGSSVLRKRHEEYAPDSSDPTISFFSAKAYGENKIYICHFCGLKHRKSLIGHAAQEENQEVNGTGEDTVTEELEELITEENGTDTPKSSKPVYLMLPKYKRVLATPSQCLFKDCNRDNLRHITDCVKRILLMEYNLYVPRNARVCKAHLYANRWHDLPQRLRTISYFAAAHIEDLLDICKATGVVLTEMKKTEKH